MLRQILELLGIKTEIWKLGGYDTFARESYHLAGPFFSEKAALRAAKRELKNIDKMQPSRDSARQQPEGKQDQIHVVRPDGSSYHYKPKPEK